MIYLFGASGHGLVILDILKKQERLVQAFVDDFSTRDLWGSLPVVNRNILPTLSSDSCFVVCIGDNAARKMVVEQLQVRYTSARHPAASIAFDTEIGEGSVVMANASVNAGVGIGRHCIINTGAVIDHECQLADFVHISPNATLCGNVQVGAGAWIGAGATVVPGIHIGAGARVGAGAVVLKNVLAGETVVGVPARPSRPISI